MVESYRLAVLIHNDCAIERLAVGIRGFRAENDADREISTAGGDLRCGSSQSDSVAGRLWIQDAGPITGEMGLGEAEDFYALRGSLFHVFDGLCKVLVQVRGRRNLGRPNSDRCHVVPPHRSCGVTR